MPHDPITERALLAAMVRYPDAIETASRVVAATDFHSPAHADVFAAICKLWDEGVKPDTATLVDELRGRVDPKILVDIAAAEVSTGSFERYASIVAEHSVRREMVKAGVELIDAAQDGDPAQVLDAHAERLEGVRLPQVQVRGLSPVSAIVRATESQRSPWVVPGLLRRDWRVIVVAPEGAGKTLMLQQVALCASQGVHPFAGTDAPAVTSLLVDTENPADRVREGCGPIMDALGRRGEWVDRCHIWHRPDGIDLRSRRTVAELEAVLYEVRPDVVCAGPNYKLADRKPGEGWDEQARAVMTVLDRLRVRFGFALLLEDHAPQTGANGFRDLRPFGSSMWLRWPELGWRFAPTERGDLVRGEWRAPRLAHGWPDELHRGGQGSLPWVGYWKDGMRG